MIDMRMVTIFHCMKGACRFIYSTEWSSMSMIHKKQGNLQVHRSMSHYIEVW